MAYCSPCNRYFVLDHALGQHERSSSAHSSQDHYGQHYRMPDDERWAANPDRHQCDLCNQCFSYEDQLDTHYDQVHEHCSECNMWLSDIVELQSHEMAVHNFCAQCNRSFSNFNNLTNHLKSSIHLPKTLACPGRGCTKKFGSAANLVLHLETNTCVSGITRQNLNHTIARLDRNNFVTNPDRMITGMTESYQATQQTWNGWNYECYLCHKEFRTLPGLNQHLASPAHEQAMYHCPKLGTNCDLQFRSLGALFQHVESGSCGVGRFKIVQEGMDRIMHGARSIAYH